MLEEEHSKDVSVDRSGYVENQEEKDEKLTSDGERVQDGKRKRKTKKWQISQKGIIFGLESIK